jgi:hypothetical protein
MPFRFDIFWGTRGDSPMWLEAADGLPGAVARMEEIARTRPGRYFVYNPDRQSVIASIETRENDREGLEFISRRIQ